jgi:Grx4 family monothiol glutaredoxin
MSDTEDVVKDFTEEPPVGRKTVLLFWAPWHEASVQGGPMDLVLRALAAASSTDESMQFGRVQAEDYPSLTEKYGVTMVPTFILLNAAGKVVERIEGGEDVSLVTVAVQRLTQAASDGIGAVSNSSSTTSTEAAVSSSRSTVGGDGGEQPNVVSAEDQLTKRLDRLIRSSEVMVFMKGVPTEPKCGFSRQTVEMLQQENIPFGSFDILSDDVVRQGLKTHSNWPTYPQLYVNGELIGGLDILQEMQEEGGLKEQLNLLDSVQADAPESLDERLSKLVKRHHIMVFMKGLPSAPLCGFSRTIVGILDELGVSYDAFNILEDEEVRQGLKTFSNWPTFPQLYVDGELIGGLDIVQEMMEDGSLKDVF